jgi:hypothetical protein
MPDPKYFSFTLTNLQEKLFVIGYSLLGKMKRPLSRRMALPM